MRLYFPEDFLWGVAASAFQWETPYDHDWKGLVTPDGSKLEETIAHELHADEDAEIISSTANALRFGPDHSRLQAGAYKKLESKAVDEYRRFMGKLKEKGMHIMLVQNHFALPGWFAGNGGWSNEESIDVFVDYARRLVDAFGDMVDSWNTLNEPGAIALEGYMRGTFPPHRKKVAEAYKVLKNLGKAHTQAYRFMKDKLKVEEPIGVSNATMAFEPFTFLGRFPAGFANALFLRLFPDNFKECDFFGMSYYGRVRFNPGAVVGYGKPEKLEEIEHHDDMWEIYPEGIKQTMEYFSDRYRKPIIITENGCCTDDDKLRKEYILKHLFYVHDAIESGVDVRGYFYWTIIDNWELQLGMDYHFGLYSSERKEKPSARLFRKIAKRNHLTLN